MAEPLFSIIIPCYNQAVYLPDCIASILSQSFSNWEAIIVNDGSTDDTHTLAEMYANKDARIRLVEKENGGLSSARNAGIRNAKGVRYLFLDADDFLKEGCLEKIASALKAANDFTWVQYGYTYIAEDKSQELHTIQAAQRDTFFPFIFNGSPGPCHTICISRSLCAAVGWFDETLKSVEDWDFWTRAVKCGAKQIVIPEALVFYRYARNSMSRNAFVMFEALKKVITRGPKKDDRITIDSPLNKDYSVNVSDTLQEMLVRCLGVAVMQGKIEEAIALFRKESSVASENCTPDSFAGMCSYLSFRYWYAPADIEEVMKLIYPRFALFFKNLGYSNRFSKKALFAIFKLHFFHRNNQRFGKGLGKIFNQMIRLKHIFAFV